MSDSETDTGVTPAKQRKPNEPEEPRVVTQQVQGDVNYEEVQFVVPEIVIEPHVYLEPEVIIESEVSVSTESAVVDQSSKDENRRDSARNHSENELDSDDDDVNNHDIQNVKQIVIVSDIDSDNSYEEEEYVGNGSSDHVNHADNHGSNESQLNVRMMRSIVIRRPVGDSDHDSFYDGDSEDSDDSLPPDWELNVTAEGVPLYYHIPSGRVTDVRPRVRRQSRRQTRTMGYDDETDLSDEE